MILERVLEDFPHLRFQKSWTMSNETLIAIGECVGMIESIADFPLTPQVRRQILQVSFSRGAQATTAIEGNTLTDSELQQMLDGKPLPQSRQYQMQEVRNALEAMNAILQKMLKSQKQELVTPNLLLGFHKLVGKDLGTMFDAIPGKFRTDRRHVGRYLAPPHEAVPELVKGLCDWLKNTFCYAKGKQDLSDAIQEAIAAHVYFEWIHPFGDGNGRTGRLLEFYILLRAGLPDLCAHILANHYNNSRQEYTTHFDRARLNRSLTEFMQYSIIGLRDGLRQTMRQLQDHTFTLAWRSAVYDRFSDYTTYSKKTIFKRRRNLALVMPVQGDFFPSKLIAEHPHVFKAYENLGGRALKGDMEQIVLLELATEIGNGMYRACTEQLLARVAQRIPTQQ